MPRPLDRLLVEQVLTSLRQAHPFCSAVSSSKLLTISLHNKRCVKHHSVSIHKPTAAPSLCKLWMSCSDIQGDVLTAMYSLVDHALADWPADKDNPPDQHYQTLLLRAISIILLNPWVDDDQTGRRCGCPLPCAVPATVIQQVVFHRMKCWCCTMGLSITVIPAASKGFACIEYGICLYRQNTVS